MCGIVGTIPMKIDKINLLDGLFLVIGSGILMLAFCNAYLHYKEELLIRN